MCRWEAELGVAELVFALMPLRHSPTVPRLERVLGHIDAREQQAEQLSELLLRFRRHCRRPFVIEGCGGAWACSLPCVSVIAGRGSVNS